MAVIYDVVTEKLREVSGNSHRFYNFSLVIDLEDFSVLENNASFQELIQKGLIKKSSSPDASFSPFSNSVGEGGWLRSDTSAQSFLAQPGEQETLLLVLGSASQGRSSGEKEPVEKILYSKKCCTLEVCSEALLKNSERNSLEVFISDIKYVHSAATECLHISALSSQKGAYLETLSHLPLEEQSYFTTGDQNVERSNNVHKEVYLSCEQNVCKGTTWYQNVLPAEMETEQMLQGGISC
eukprot:766145-Hanusia_phi.AAC.5